LGCGALNTAAAADSDNLAPAAAMRTQRHSSGTRQSAWAQRLGRLHQHLSSSTGGSITGLSAGQRAVAPTASAAAATKKPRVALVGTGGTISSTASDPLTLIDYGGPGHPMLSVHEVLERVPQVHAVADILPVPYKAVPSTEMSPSAWLELVEKIHTVVEEHPDVEGIVVTHGTATLEETAYFLSLTLKISVPVVVVGSQRPISALSSDGGLNLVNAVRVAGHPDSVGLGVLTVLNDEIQSAREVTKTSTLRLQTFRSPDFGCLGHVDGDRVSYYRRPTRRSYPDTEFDVRGMAELPRVDIVYAYAGADGAMAQACVDAGAKGIVSAGFAPGSATSAQREVIEGAEGVTFVQSTRAGSGRVAESARRAALSADNLSPQKARILLMLGAFTYTYLTYAGDNRRAVFAQCLWLEFGKI
jgi:L-asparaginase